MTQNPITDLDRIREAGASALHRQDPSAARVLFERVLAARPADESAWFGLALACRGIGDDVGQLNALDRVLVVNPSHLRALLMKADHFAKVGDGRAAGAFFQAVVARAPALETLPPELLNEVLRAQRRSTQYAQAYESHLCQALKNIGFDQSTSSRRFNQSLDLLLGKKQVYFQSPSAFYFAELPQRQFYERTEFPWLVEFEGMAGCIREELREVLRDNEAFRPYVQSDDSRPPKEFGDLRDNSDWSAFYLIKNGSLVPEAARSCPKTIEAVGSLPLTDVPGRMPSVLFSLLRPGTRIPPHTGMNNARLICHLPLIVPESCSLRVGNEIRSWVEGETLIFDDTIEHEAWNNSGQLRVVLLFEIWRPELTFDERGLVGAMLSAIDTYGR